MTGSSPFDPELVPPPAFDVDPSRRDWVLRRSRSRRQRKALAAIAGCTAALISTVWGLAGISPVATTDGLVASQPPAPAPTVANTRPTSPPTTTARPQSGANNTNSLGPSTPNDLVIDASPSLTASPNGAAVAVVRRFAIPNSADATRCRQSSDWSVSGWCFTLDTKLAWPVGHRIELRTSACRLRASGDGTLTFATAEQVRFRLTENGRELYDTEGVGRTAPGEMVQIAAGDCLQWRSQFVPEERPTSLNFEFQIQFTDSTRNGYRDSQKLRVYAP